MAEGLKIQVEADVKQAVKSLKELDQQAHETFKRTGSVFAPAASKAATSLDKFSKSTNTATQATINLSRVAQDAPYGFIGIANNLNPLLESFERLKTQTGSSSAAFKELRKSMIGPAGLGLGLGILSSLLIQFGDTLLGSFNKIGSSAKILNKAMAEGLNETRGQVFELRTLLGIARDVSRSYDERKAAVDRLNKSQKDFNNSLTVQNVNNQAYLDIADKIVAKNIAEAQAKSILTQITNLQTAAEAYRQYVSVTSLGSRRVNKEIRKIEDRIKSLTASYTDLISKSLSAESNTFGNLGDVIGKRLAKEFSKPIKKGKDPFQEWVKEWERQIAAFNFTLPISPDFALDFKKVQFIMLGGEIKTLTERVQDFINKSIEKLVVSPRINLTPQAAQNIANLDLFRKQQAELSKIFGFQTDDSPLSQMQKDAVLAAQTINSVLAPAFQGLFDAIIQGEQPLKAFFEGIGQAVVQLIQKLIQAALTAAILSAIFPAGIGGAKGFGALFGKILGFAQGGIVSGPTLALIGEGAGTSRSNPEVVAPLDQLRSMLSDLGGSGTQRVIITGRLRGNDMLLQNARTSRTQRRTTGR